MQGTSVQVTHNVVSAVGLQTVSVAGCTYAAGAIGQICNNSITLPVAQADTSYHTQCGIRGSSGVNGIANITNSSTTVVIVGTVALQTSSTGGGFIDCIVTHQ
jgi:hypothetical protein